MDEKTSLKIYYDHHEVGLSYRTLASKYGISRTTIHRMVMSKQKKEVKARVIRKEEPVEETPLPDNVDVLKEELRKARLKIELQDLIIDISGKELGIDLRKKHGTRQSK